VHAQKSRKAPNQSLRISPGSDPGRRALYATPGRGKSKSRQCGGL
jgi:hypothetical protein